MDIADTAHRTIHNPKHGGSKALALRLGLSSTVLNNKANPNNTSHHLRLDEAITIMELTGDTSIMHAIASRLGGTFCLVDGDSSDGDIVTTAFNATKGIGNISALLATLINATTPDLKSQEQLQTQIQLTMSHLQKLAQELGAE